MNTDFQHRCDFVTRRPQTSLDDNMVTVVPLVSMPFRQWFHLCGSGHIVLAVRFKLGLRQLCQRYLTVTKTCRVKYVSTSQTDLSMGDCNLSYLARGIVRLTYWIDLSERFRF